jgi:hypothetical protein
VVGYIDAWAGLHKVWSWYVLVSLDEDELWLETTSGFCYDMSVQ